MADQSKALFENSQSAGSNAGTVAGIKAGIDERVPNNHTGFACILSLPDGTQWLGLGRNKKSAQHDAAAKCLKETKNIFVPLPEGAGLQTVGGTPGRDKTNIFQYIDYDSDGEIENSGKSMGKSGFRISVTFKL